MPVRRFRSIEEMSSAPVLPTGRSPWERMRELLRLSALLSPNRWAPGVSKSRSIEEANRRRMESEKPQSKRTNR